MKKVLSVLVLVLPLAAGALAEIPQVMGYQGRVTDNAGNPVGDGSYMMQFRIYDNSTGSGSPLWDSGSQSVAVSGGVFSVVLGESPQPALGLAFDQDYWLLVTFSGQNQTPLRRLGSVGYAYMASGLVPGTKVEGTLSGMFQAAVRGVNLVTNGPNFGLSGACSSTEGAGVFGYGVATSGTNYGVYGETESPLGYGVYGSNSSGWAGGFDGNVEVDGRLELPNLDATPSAGSGSMEVGNSLRIDGNEIITNTDHMLHLQRDNNGDLKVDEGTLFVDASANRVGVRTTTPDYVLHALDSGTGSYAGLGAGEFGVVGSGTTAGGEFSDSNGGSGYARVGAGDYGVRGVGDTAGGYFYDDDDPSYAYVGYGNKGIEAAGYSYGGIFKNLGGGGGDEYAYAAWIGYGIAGYGGVAGGYFVNLDGSGYCRAGHGTNKVSGNGSVSFVQNHPERNDRVIVYSAPEGDEVATYTRGTARLSEGVARVGLGETFACVTNPDIGLTAHLTPRGDCNGLYVEELTTSELVVRELGGGSSEAAFDYVVYGLRIGFEEVTIVQEKDRESYIPSMTGHREACARHPDLRHYTALERFRRMHVEVTGGDEPDLSGARALRDAIEEYDPVIHGPVGPEAEREAQYPNKEAPPLTKGM